MNEILMLIGLGVTAGWAAGAIRNRMLRRVLRSISPRTVTFLIGGVIFGVLSTPNLGLDPFNGFLPVAVIVAVAYLSLDYLQAKM